MILVICFLTNWTALSYLAFSLLCSVTKALLSPLSYRLNRVLHFLHHQAFPTPPIFPVLSFCVPSTSTAPTPKQHSHISCTDLQIMGSSWPIARNSSKISWLGLIYFYFFSDKLLNEQKLGWESNDAAGVKVQEAFPWGQQQPCTLAACRTSHLTVPEGNRLASYCQLHQAN